MRDRFQELVELGARGTAFRLWWELSTRSGLRRALEREPPRLAAHALVSADELIRRLPFEPGPVAAAMRPLVGEQEFAELRARATGAAQGRVLAFGRWDADYGLPVDWYRNPVAGERWTPERHWTRALSEEGRVGDVKLTWELGRFPHAYAMGRAAAFDGALAGPLGHVLGGQVESFLAAAPFGRGIHWASGQEVVFRLMAWLFALTAFGPRAPFAARAPDLCRALHAGAVHLERHLGYSRFAVYNNHLLSEALGLLLAGELLSLAPEAPRWRALGRELLEEQADRQFYEDGGYIQLSHTYERVALQVYLWAVALLRRKGEAVPARWLAALDRAVGFLSAQQNPADGRLPNAGANDGALPSPLTSCDYTDFRPTLQAASLAARGTRLYPPGPWDEEAAWFLGPAALEAPVAPPPRESTSFPATGYHVLRGDPGSFGVLRCGTVRDRFSQVDMLHLDVFWRGENVVVDGGSYLYNGPAAWHDHFMRTESHSTMKVDGRDQMLHLRRFKNLYRTPAALLRWERGSGFTLAEGEHRGYARHPGGCVHRRAVLLAGDGLWVVVDRVEGEGEHAAELQWLCGDYPHTFDADSATLALLTPGGDFQVRVLDEAGGPLAADVVAGAESPPRGWLSRYYGEKVPVPSLRVERRGACPVFFVSVLSGGKVDVAVEGERWSVAGPDHRVAFTLAAGELADLRVERA